mmetsp:Transcript_40143/g.94352  ORF Transcript_40143/g.94352 Transcript_40143/m.94352 type:complete len:257 (-) Transcript_40143:500-1270(-)
MRRGAVGRAVGVAAVRAKAQLRLSGGLRKPRGGSDGRRWPRDLGGPPATHVRSLRGANPGDGEGIVPRLLRRRARHGARIRRTVLLPVRRPARHLSGLVRGQRPQLKILRPREPRAVSPLHKPGVLAARRGSGAGPVALLRAPQHGHQALAGPGGLQQPPVRHRGRVPAVRSPDRLGALPHLRPHQDAEERKGRARRVPGSRGRGTSTPSRGKSDHVHRGGQRGVHERVRWKICGEELDGNLSGRRQISRSSHRHL